MPDDLSSSVTDRTPSPPLPEPAAPAAEVPPVEQPPPSPPPAEPPPLPPAATVPPLPPGPGPQAFAFYGTTREYFRIWIVNTLLILLTGGLFFAWARVRKRRYLRGSTELLGHRFDYRADPRRLLIGTALVAAIFLAYSLFGAVYPPVRLVSLLLALLLLPWVIVRSLTFNARNTVYRGLSFRFNPSLGAAVKTFLMEPVLIGLTAGLYYPAWARSKRNYLVSNHRLGDAYFHFEARTGPFYGAHLVGGCILFGFLLLAGIGIGAVTALAGVGNAALLLVPLYALYGLGLFISRQYIYARLFNHIWNHTRLNEHRFSAHMKTGHWLGLQLTNLGAILASAGLLYPWAAMRAQRYVASCLLLLPAGPVDDIARIGQIGDKDATGDTAAEFLGLDFGL